MRGVLRIVLVIPLAYIAACLAAGLAVAVGAEAGDPRAGINIGGLTLVALFIGAGAGGMFAATTLVAVLLTEILGWRSVFIWLAVGGLSGLAAQLLLESWNVAFAMGEPMLFVAAGLVGGAVYWAIAGRRAGVDVAIASGPAHP